MEVIFKSDKGTLVHKKSGYFVKTNGKEVFVGKDLNQGLMNDFCYLGIIELCHEKAQTQQNLNSIDFNNF